MKIQAEDNYELQKSNHNDMQMMPLAEAQTWYNEFVRFSKSILKMDLDYGVKDKAGQSRQPKVAARVVAPSPPAFHN